jgi:lysophospholipid acyltransferase (LPLAT)-like uncharacterized protein
MKLRHPLVIQGWAIAAACLIRTWMNTIRVQSDYRASGRQPVNPRQERFIYAFWHESMLATTIFRTRIKALISQHADGEFVAQIFRHLRIGTVRGSTNRGGVGAMLRMVKASRDSHIGILPDGPRGPRRQVHPGLLSLAKHTGLPIIGVGVGFTNAWRFKSWDRFAVPMPCSSIRIVTTLPLGVPGTSNSDELEKYRVELENRMLGATKDAENWAAGRARCGIDCSHSVLAD